jgi:DNA helicase IV
VKITKVSFERLKTFGNFENVRVGAEAEISQDEGSADDPNLALSNLISWVDSKISEIINKPWEDEHEGRMAELYDEERKLRDEIEQKREELKTLVKKIYATHTLLNESQEKDEIEGVNPT